MAVPRYLQEICDRKREDLPALMAADPPEEVRARAKDAEPPRDFLKALQPMQTDVHLIAELKKASPSKGLIRADFDPVALGKEYDYNGAAAISILTEQHYFQGDPASIRSVKRAVKAPILRKDFLFDPWQIAESRALGADAILLIAAMLEEGQLSDLAGLASEYGMAALIEIHTEEELSRVPKGAKLVGVNNRNLETFDVSLDTSLYLLPLAEEHGPPDRVLVAESGILTRQDVLSMHEAGADAILVGEALMRRDHVRDGIRELLGIG